MNSPGRTSATQYRYRRFVAAGFAVVTSAALVVIIVGGLRDDSPSPTAALDPSLTNVTPADTGAYIPPLESSTDLTYSPTAEAASTAAAVSTGRKGNLTNPAEVGAPTNITNVAQVNGRFPYTLATIDRASPDQVAWAYTTLRYTVTWNDTDSQQSTTRAATYTTPTPSYRTGTTPPTEWQAASSAQWQQAVKAHVLSTVSVTSLTVQLGAAAPGGFTIVSVSWVTTTSRNDQPTVTVPGTSTLTLAAQADGTWLVAGTGSDQPG